MKANRKIHVQNPHIAITEFEEWYNDAKKRVNDLFKNKSDTALSLVIICCAIGLIILNYC